MIKMAFSNFIKRCYIAAMITTLFLPATTTAQTQLSLNDLSAFKSSASNWKIAGDVNADLNRANVLNISGGSGILVSLPEDKTAADLITNFEHGDLDLELDYMMAKGSNSGIYMQGRYEVQLLDSWGVQNPKPGDNGGIYQRWDESRGKGKEGYEGQSPRQNASKAPGLWQHLKISFQAPRFDGNGNKVENAKMLRIELNGALIHENVELSGPTRSAMMNNEGAFGPLQIQGDHGPVAFRNIVLKNYNKPRPELTNIRYTVYKGKFEKEADFARLPPPEATGSSTILTSAINKIDNKYLIRFNATLKVKEPGEYNFSLNAPGGGGILKINDQIVVPITQWGTGKINLPAGDLGFELLYSKFESWTRPALGLTVTGPGIREYLLSEATTSVNEVVNPILIDASENKTLRSFVDIPGGKRIIHAINVGTADQIHYSYDLDKGSLFQLWRGGFLDATPMWHGRGDGSSHAQGSILFLGEPAFILAKLPSANAAWITDTTGTAFIPKGYTMNANNEPTFQYFYYGASIKDVLRPLKDRSGIQREITIQNSTADWFARIAEGKIIEKTSNGLYIIDDKSYYLRFDESDNGKPFIRDINGTKELLVPVKGKVRYAVIF